MKKTIIKCAVFSLSMFLLIHIVATRGYFRRWNDTWTVVLQIALLIAALPAYFFVKRDEEKLFIYPATMTVGVLLNFVLFCVLIVALEDNNIIKDWSALLYPIGWYFLLLYFIIVLVIDFMIAIVARIKANIFKKNNNE